MIRIRLSKTNAEVLERERLTSGQVNMVKVKFEFSNEWNGLTRIAVFTCGEVTKDYELDDTNECFVPAEVTLDKGLVVLCGVYGTKDSTLVIPSVYARLGTVIQGAKPGSDEVVKTPGIWEQALIRLEKIEGVADAAAETAKKIEERANEGEFDGEKGEPFTYEDLTDEQKQELNAKLTEQYPTKKEVDEKLDEAMEGAVLSPVDLTTVTTITQQEANITTDTISPIVDWTNYEMVKGIINVTGYCEIEVENTSIDMIDFTINGESYYILPSSGVTAISFKGYVNEPITFEMEPSAVAKFTRFVATSEYKLRNEIMQAVDESGHATKDEFDAIILSDLDLTGDGVVTWDDAYDITVSEDTILNNTNYDGVYDSGFADINITGYCEIEAVGAGNGGKLTINGVEYDSSANTISFMGNVTEPINVFLLILGGIKFTKFKVYDVQQRVTALEADIGDIDTALDSIIAIQEALIGGAE